MRRRNFVWTASGALVAAAAPGLAGCVTAGRATPSGDLATPRPAPGAPPRRRGWLERPFGRLYYEVTGAGPAIVFAHGLSGSHLTWWQQVAHFSRTHTCVTFAHRGFAPSDPVTGGPDPRDYAGDLGALLDYLGLAEVRLVAQSMGGWTALEYALREPGRVSALVLASTCGTLDRRAADPSGGVRYDDWLRDAEARVAGLMARGIHPAMGARALEHDPALHLLYCSIEDMGGPVDREPLRRRLRAAAVHRLPDLLVSAPTLLVTGEEDVLFPTFIAPTIAAALPRGQVEPVPRVGHSVYFEQAGIFNEVVEGFLRRS